MLRRYRLFSLTQEVIFCFDGDSAGRKAAWRVLEMSLSVLQDGYSLRFLILPEGEDPDSFVRKKSRAAFMECLDQAQYLGDFLFEGCLEQIDMTQLEGKARFVKRVVPLLEQISPGILQYKLFEKLATFVNMDTQTLKQLAGSMIVPVQKNKTVRKPAAYPAALSPMRLAIALIVQHPDAYVIRVTNSSAINA
ncbi:toprim domain-containing protein [Rickettsiella massiliensis]|uniref:toprim domain-containing protein n=1 Tax=Rickettsiella massiliensis TaxID=676517 RepID=UPI00178C78C4|nr:toprim domain-containing protein [Rickettsiella massiliensis]